MSDPIAMFTCDWCGKDFPAHPDAMQSSGFSMTQKQDAADAWKGGPAIQEVTMPVEEASEDMIAAMKEAMNLNDEQVKTLLENGYVETGVSCICLKCQEDGEQEESDETTTENL